MGPRPRSRHLRRLLRRLIFHLKLQAAVKGLEYYAGGATAFLAAAVLADLAVELSSESRAKVLAVFAVGSIVWLIVGAILPFARRINPLYAAQLVEEACPECESALLTLVEDRGGTLDEGVAGFLEERLDAVLANVDGRSCAPPADLAGAHRVLSAVMVAGVVVSLVGGQGFFNSLVRVLFPGSSGMGGPAAEFAAIVPGEVVLREGESLHIRAEVRNMSPAGVFARFAPEEGEAARAPLARGAGKRWSGVVGPVTSQGRYVVVAASRREGVPDLVSRSFRVGVRRYPRIDDLRVTYTYPAYAGIETRTVAEPRIDCLEGTRVRVEFSASRDLRKAGARIEPGGPVELRDAGGGRRAFEFDVRASGLWQASLVSGGGLERTVGPYPVVVRPDAAPEAVAIAEVPPGGRAAAGVNVTVRASDDYGLAGAELLLARSGEPGRALAVPRARGRRSFFARMRIPRDAFGEGSGTFTYRLRVTDTRSPEANVTLSRERSLDLVAGSATDSLFEPPPRRLKRKRRGDASGGRPREVELAQGSDEPGRAVDRLGGESSGGEAPPRPPEGPGEGSDYTGLTGERPPQEPAERGEKGEPGEPRRPEPGGDEPGPKREAPREPGSEPGDQSGEPRGDGESAGERRAPPGKEGEGPAAGELPVPPDATGGGPGGDGPPPRKVGREKISARGERTEVPETVDERRVNELEFADDEVARLAGEDVGARTDFGEAGGPGGETSVGRGAGAAGGRSAPAGVAVEALAEDELPADPAAPRGAVAVELSRRVEPEYRPLVTDYFRRLGGER